MPFFNFIVFGFFPYPHFPFVEHFSGLFCCRIITEVKWVVGGKQLFGATVVVRVKIVFKAIFKLTATPNDLYFTPAFYSINFIDFIMVAVFKINSAILIDYVVFKHCCNFVVVVIGNWADSLVVVVGVMVVVEIDFAVNHIDFN